jgi:uncharacterized membrane protein YvbJ
MKKCPYCGHEVADDVFHCPKCLAGIPHGEEQKQDKSDEVSKRRNRTK